MAVSSVRKWGKRNVPVDSADLDVVLPLFSQFIPVLSCNSVTTMGHAQPFGSSRLPYSNISVVRARENESRIVCVSRGEYPAKGIG